MKMTQKEPGLKKGASHIGVLVFAAGLLLTALAAGYLIRTDSENKKNEVYRIKEVYAARLETRLNSLFHKTDVLEAVILTFGDQLSENTFYEVARSLDTEDGIRAIQYLPGGTVQYCYPVEGNESAIGGNVFDNPKRREDALLAVKTKEIALSGPYELTQGGLGLVARNPIFTVDERGGESFWGFAVLILDLPEALTPVGLKELGGLGYAYCLTSEGEDGEPLVIERGGSEDMRQAVTADIHVPNHTWTLSVMPENGWINYLKYTLLILAGVLFSFMGAKKMNTLYKSRNFFKYYAVMD